MSPTRRHPGHPAGGATPRYQRYYTALLWRFQGEIAEMAPGGMIFLSVGSVTSSRTKCATKRRYISLLICKNRSLSARTSLLRCPKRAPLAIARPISTAAPTPARCISHSERSQALPSLRPGLEAVDKAGGTKNNRDAPKGIPVIGRDDRIRMLF